MSCLYNLSTEYIEVGALGGRGITQVSASNINDKSLMIVLERILECVSVLYFVRKKNRLFDSIVLIIYKLNVLLNVDASHATTNSLHCHSVPNAWARRIDFQPWMILNYLLTVPFFNFHAWQLSMSNTELLKYSFVNVI